MNWEQEVRDSQKPGNKTIKLNPYHDVGFQPVGISYGKLNGRPAVAIADYFMPAITIWGYDGDERTLSFQRALRKDLWPSLERPARSQGVAINDNILWNLAHDDIIFHTRNNGRELREIVSNGNLHSVYSLTERSESIALHKGKLLSIENYEEPSLRRYALGDNILLLTDEQKLSLGNEGEDHVYGIGSLGDFLVLITDRRAQKTRHGIYIVRDEPPYKVEQYIGQLPKDFPEDAVTGNGVAIAGDDMLVTQYGYDTEGPGRPGRVLAMPLAALKLDS